MREGGQRKCVALRSFNVKLSVGIAISLLLVIKQLVWLETKFMNRTAIAIKKYSPVIEEHNEKC